MFIAKINQYLFVQICKYFILILFIFLSIAWLLQITRLFTISNLMHINMLDVFYLSFYLLPNLITVITPFILIFGLLLCFLKLNKDNELIAILSLGLGLKPFKKTLIFFCIIILIFFSLLNFYLSPIVYEKYKLKEFDMRNSIDLNNMEFSNFLNLNQNTILDFKKNNNGYEDILISFYDEKENIVYAKKGIIYNENNKFVFELIDGFKISINERKEIEKLEFLNYVLKVENKNIIGNKVIDKNTYTIFDDISSKNYLNITFKILDLILIIFIVFFFYKNNIIKINFKTTNNIFFSLMSISLLIINQILKNSQILLESYIMIILLSIIFISLSTFILKKYEQN